MSNPKRSPFCEPCCECAWCDQRYRWRDQARERGADLRAALKLITVLADCLADECMAAGADEVRQHPTLRSHARAVELARRFVRSHSKSAK